MPNRIESTLDVILSRIVERLKFVIPGADDQTCYLADDPDELRSGLLKTAPAEVCFLVCPAPGGQFDPAFWAGGGEFTIEVNTVVTVTVHKAIELADQQGRGRELLTAANRGLFSQYMPLVMTALAGHDLTNTDGNWILSKALEPLDYNWDREPKRRTSSIQIGFGVNWQQKFTAAV